MITKDRAEADDLAQNTVLKALDRSGQFAAGTHLDRWLFQIAKRIWLNELRSRRVRRGQGIVDIADVELPASGAKAETNIFATEVLEMIGKLPQAQRLCVLLVYAEGLSYREASEVLEVPIGTIMSRLASARARIAGQLGSSDMSDE